MDPEPARELRRVERLVRRLELREDLHAPPVAEGAMTLRLEPPEPIGP
jgi:hypothetical protein